MDHTRLFPTTLLVSCALVPAVLGGCAAPTTTRDNAPSAALEDLGSSPAKPKDADPGRRSLAEAARQSAQDLEVLMNRERPVRTIPQTQGDAGQTPEPTGEQRPWQRDTTTPTTQEPTQEPSEAQSATAPVEADPQTELAEPIEVVAPPPDPIALMLERLEQDAANPDLALSATLLAQAMRAYNDTNDGSRPRQSLSPPEQQLAELLRPVIEALAAGERSDAPQRIGEAMDRAALELAAVLPVRINDVALATDIHGFASYDAFERYSFQAGQVNRVLVYTEPVQFESRPTANPSSQGEAANAGAYEVLLGLELRLFNERGSMLAWRRPEERVAIRSGRPRSEIYMGTLIELPASLTVGRYQLKVIVRDLADGSEDERVIPIEIVADPRLTTRTTRDR